MENRIAKFAQRLNKLPIHEQKTVKKALHKLAQVTTLTDDQYEELGSSVLTSWEQGRLKGLISEISEKDDFSEHELLDILLESQVLTSLNIAEAVKTKILTVGELKLRIQKQELENAVRDYIAANPWMVAPELETFKVETSVKKMVESAAKKAKLEGDDWKGRIDLALSSGKALVILEFMRPGLKLNWDHINRFDNYIRIINMAVKANTGGLFNAVTGYLVADKIETDSAMLNKIEAMEKEGMYTLDWDTFFGKALSRWEEFLKTLVNRVPDDSRLKALLE